MAAEATSSSFQSITIKSFQSVHPNVFEFLFCIQSGGVAAHAPSGRLAHQWTSSSWMGTRSRRTCSTLGQCNLALISENPKSTSTFLPTILHDIWIVFQILEFQCPIYLWKSFKMKLYLKAWGPMVANMATRPCLISVSRRLGDQRSRDVTRNPNYHDQHVALPLDMYSALHSWHCCITCLMSIQHPTRPLEDFDILVCRKTKGVPKAEGCLVTHKPFKALAAWCIAQSTVYLLEAFVCTVLLQVCTPHSTEDR